MRARVRQARQPSAAFWSDRNGGVALFLGIALPALVLAGTGAIELTEMMSARTNLQNIIDAAALTGARELNTDRSSATATRTEAQAQSLALILYPRWTIATSVSIDLEAGKVTVSQTGTRASLFGILPSARAISVKATAELRASKPLCVLGIQNTASDVIRLQDTAAMKADNCLVQSNGNMRAGNSSAIQAGAAYAVGAATGAINPAPITDVPMIADPFASMPIEVPAGCDDIIGLTLPGGTLTLNPGVHCGLYVLTGQTTLVLNPGEHYFANGSFVVLGQATIKGSDVVVVFKGLSALSFSENALLDLDGRKSGKLAGFVLVTDRSFTGTLNISTDRARNLHGTVYLPNATLNVSGSANRVADQSPWTVLLAKQINVAGSANLMINAGFNTSSVPVPEGVGPNVPLRLTR